MNMTTLSGRRRIAARRALLSLTTILAAGAVIPAQAQVTAPAPVQQAVDGNGVDLFLGTFNLSRPDLVIGDGDLGLNYTRTWRGSSWSDNYDIHITQAGNRYTVTIGDFAEDFILQGNTFYNAQGSRSGLDYSGSTYQYHAADGTRYVFDTAKAYNTVTNGDLARVTGIYKRNNDTTVFRYNQYSVCVSGSCSARKTVSRLASVIRNQAFTVELSYATDTADQPSQLGDFYRVTAATVRNYAVDCDVTSASCKNSLTATYDNGSATDAEGRTDQYQLAGSQITGIQHAGSGSVDTTVGYDGSGKVQSVVTPATSTTYGYADDPTANERTTTITDGLNHARHAVFDLTSHLMKRITDENGETTTFIRDDLGRPSKIIAPEGSESIGYTGYTYDYLGNVLQVTQVPKDGSTPIATSATYACLATWDCSKPSTTTDAGGNVTNYAYDSNSGALTSITGPASASGAPRPQTRFLYKYLQPRVKDASNNLSYGVQTQVVVGTSTCRTGASCAGTADETVTTFGRGTASDNTSPGANPLAVVSITTSAGDGSLSSSNGRTYDGIGNVVSSTDAAGATTSDAYNNDRELISTTSADPDGAGPLKARRIANHYDAHGLVDSVGVGTVDASGTFAASQYRYSVYDSARRKVADRANDGTADYALTQYGYDAAGRLECVAQRMDPSTFSSLSTSACSQTTHSSPDADRITRTSFDPAGQVTTVTSAYGTASPTVDASLTYTPDGKIATATDANGHVTSYTYDGFDHAKRTCFLSPNQADCAATPSDYEELHYDAAGRLDGRRIRDGRSFAFGYDLRNRLTTKTVPAGSGMRNVYYVYDLQDHPTEAHFDSATGSDAVVNGYDALGRVTSSTTAMGGVSRQLGYGYDAVGRRTSITHPDGVRFATTYDAVSEANAASWQVPGSSVVPFMGITYDDLGRRTSTGRGSSATGYVWNASGGRLGSLSQQFAGGAGNVTDGFTYNPADQVAGKTRSNDDYAYTGATNLGSSYLANGLNQYTSVGGKALGYDGNANLTSDGTDTYAYDAENRLIASSKNGTALAYDPVGRLWQVTSGTTGKTQFLYDGDQLAAEYNGDTGSMLRRYAFAPGVDEPILQDEGGALACTGTRFLSTDAQGSVVAQADCSGNRTSVNTYDDYGVPRASNQGRFQYTGQAWLPEVGLYYYKARMYSPVLGRFMQTDPIGYGDGMNAYRYAGNDPVNAKDPTGLDPCDSSDPCYNLPTIGFPPSVPTTSSGSSPSYVFPGLSPIANFLDRLFGGSSTVDAQQAPPPKPDRPQSVGCTTRLPNGKTVGDYVRQYRAQVQSSFDSAMTAAQYGGEGDPLSAATGTFGGIVRDYGPIDFKNQLSGNRAALGRAGNFAYYAIGAGILPNAELDAGAGAYGIVSALRGQKSFSSLTGRMFSDASANSQRAAGLAANGC